MPVSLLNVFRISGTLPLLMASPRNIGNMRVPCAALALDVMKSKSGTIQAEIVSTMAICGSIITNLVATTSFGLLIPTVLKLFVPVPAWMVIVCAVFGTLGIARLIYNSDQKKESTVKEMEENAAEA